MLPQVASAHRAFDKALQQISDDAAKKNAATEGRGSRRCSMYQKKKYFACQVLRRDAVFVHCLPERDERLLRRLRGKHLASGA
jgi:hypothetical protein